MAPAFLSNTAKNKYDDIGQFFKQVVVHPEKKIDTIRLNFEGWV
jgi:hypothetical protein